jgi:hypothetical protein
VGVLELLGFVGQGVVDRLFEGGHVVEAALGDLMLFDVIPDRFDRGLLRAASRRLGRRRAS